MTTLLNLPPSLSQDLILRRRSDTFDSLLGFPQPLGVIGGGIGNGGNLNDNDKPSGIGGNAMGSNSPLQSIYGAATMSKAQSHYLPTSSKSILPERRPSAISEANSAVKRRQGSFQT